MLFAADHTASVANHMLFTADHIPSVANHIPSVAHYTVILMKQSVTLPEVAVMKRKGVTPYLEDDVTSPEEEYSSAEDNVTSPEGGTFYIVNDVTLVEVDAATSEVAKYLQMITRKPPSWLIRAVDGGRPPQPPTIR